MYKFIIYSFISLAFINSAIAQRSPLTGNEIGIVFGPSMLKSDYGERKDSDTNFGNSGFGVGLVHYLNFSPYSRSSRYFNQHFKVRSELSFNQTKLEHFGRWVEGNSNSIGKQQLRAMEGKSSVFTIAEQLEYYPFNQIQDYDAEKIRLLPYASFGLGFSYYITESSSTMGEMGSIDATFPKYLVPSDGHPYGFSSENKGTFSVVSGVGTHYRMSEYSSIMIEGRLQYFTTDWVDGLNPNKDIYKENKSNDWQLWFSVGYIYLWN